MQVETVNMGGFERAHGAMNAAYNALALSLAEKGWYDEALDVLRAALSISPDDESVKDNMDYIQSLKEDDDGAKGVILMSLILQLMKKKELSE